MLSRDGVLMARSEWSHRMSDLAEWMAENGGTVPQAAKALGISRDNAKHIWQRIRKRLGDQAI
jgi:hypothetical protein